MQCLPPCSLFAHLLTGSELAPSWILPLESQLTWVRGCLLPCWLHFLWARSQEWGSCTGWQLCGCSLPGAAAITSCGSGLHPCLLSPCSNKVKSRSLGYRDGVEFRLPCRPQGSCPVYHPDNLKSPLYKIDPAYPMERCCVSRSRVTRNAGHKQSK